MNNTNLIGFLGSAGSGKDEAAKYLVHQYGWLQMALADPLKVVAKQIYDFTDTQLWGPSAERNRGDDRYVREDGTLLSPRIALQLLGTSFGRAAYPNTWVDMLIRQVQQVLDGNAVYSREKGLQPIPLTIGRYVAPGGIAVSDVRFENEIRAIQKAGGFVVRLKRQGIADPTAIGIKNHVSETEMMGIPDSAVDYVIYVQEGIEKFHGQLDSMMKYARKITEGAAP